MQRINFSNMLTTLHLKIFFFFFSSGTPENNNEKQDFIVPAGAFTACPLVSNAGIDVVTKESADAACAMEAVEVLADEVDADGVVCCTRLL